MPPRNECTCIFSNTKHSVKNYITTKNKYKRWTWILWLLLLAYSMNLKGNAAPEARGARPFQHSNIYYDTFFSQNAAVAIFQKGLSQKCGKCGKCGNFFIKCGQHFENVGNVGPLGTLHLLQIPSPWWRQTKQNIFPIIGISEPFSREV